jgi:dTDP-4-dehydrorhamnose 3,5-epimerase
MIIKMETYKESDFQETGLSYKFVQDNQFSSHKGLLRGLYCQNTRPQAKLVRVLSGEVFCVTVGLLTVLLWFLIMLNSPINAMN